MINLNELKTKSNLLSLFRLFLAIPIYYFIENINSPEYNRIILFGIFFLVYITDILDGYLARKFNEVTEMGKIIDPLADKVVVITIVVKFWLDGMIPDYYFWTIVLRDLIIFLGGIYVSKRIGKVLPSNKLGKITVLTIASYILCVLAQLDIRLPWMYDLFLYASLTLSFLSVIAYAMRGYDAIKWSKNETV